MLEYYITLGTVVFGILGGIFFLFDWFRHKRRHPFLLLWAIGFFLLFGFQVPMIKGNEGAELTLTDFNNFFAIMFPLSMLALVLIYAGLESVRGVFSRRKKWFAFLFIAAATAAFEADFLLNAGVLQNYIFMFATLFIFHAPIEFLIARSAWRLRNGTEISRAGAAIMAMGGIFGMAQDFLVAYKVWTYPPAFWFTALMQFTLLHTVQILSVLCLLVGAILVHRRYVFANIQALRSA